MANDQALPEQQPECVVFELDARNVITATGALWNAFALSNDAPQLADGSVVGKSLLHFVSGDISRAMVRTLLETARLAQIPLEMDYRCDSPEVRRTMRMRLEPREDGSMRCSNTLLHSELRKRPIRFECARERGRDTVVRCSLCNRIKHRERWMEADRLNPASHPLIMKVTYGVCQDCLLKLVALRAESAGQTA